METPPGKARALDAIGRESDAGITEMWRAESRVRRMGIALIAYLSLTLVAFLALGDVGNAVGVPKMSGFYLFGVLLFALTYNRSLKFGVSQMSRRSVRPVRRAKSPVGIAVLGSIYNGVYYVVLMRTAGLGFSDVVVGGMNPGRAYNQRAYVLEELTSRFLSVMNLFAIVGVAGLVLLPVVWNELRPPLRVLVGGCLAMPVFYSLAIGTMKGIGDLVIALLFGSFVARSRAKPDVGDGSKWRISAPLTLTVAFLAFASFGFAGRLMDVGAEGAAEVDPLIQSLLPSRAALGITQAVAYPTHGFIGLSYALDSPKDPSFSVTGSPGVGRLLDSYLGTNTSAMETYRTTIASTHGFRLNTWPTALVDWAGDVGWIGAMLILGVLGWWLARSMLEAVLGSTAALILAYQLFVATLWIPANNQLFLTSYGSIAFIESVLIYGAWRMHSKADNPGRARNQIAADRWPTLTGYRRGDWRGPSE